MKKRTVIKLTLLILILIVTFLIIRSTYSKYITKADDNATLHIANWNIKLNDKDISENKDFTENMKLIFDRNDYIAENVIAPTSTGSFKVKIESTGTELPFKYDLQIAEPIDSISTYKIDLTNYVKDDWNKKTQIFFSVYIDYSYRDTPVAYYDSSGKLVYDKIPITLSIPSGKLNRAEMDNYESMEFSDGTFSFIPQWYQWSNDNILTTTVRLYYDEIIELSSITTPVENLTLGGKVVKKTNLPDFRIYSYTKNGSAPIPVNASDTTISDIVEPPVDADGKFTGEEVINDYTFYFEWYDGIDNILDNQNDVLVSKTNSTTDIYTTPNAVIPISLKITQVE